MARRQTALPLLIVAADFTLYGLCAFAAIASGQTAAKILFSVLAGMFVSLLAIVGHDAGHRSLTGVRWLNEVLGTVAFLPSLHPFGRWKYHHNQVHHRFTAQLGVDNAYPPMSVADYRSASRAARARYRLKRSLAGQAAHYLCDVWFPKMFLPRPHEWTNLGARDRTEIVLVWAWPFVFTGGMAAVVHFASGRTIGGALVDTAVFGFLLPFVTWNLFISFVTIVQHTGPDVHWVKPTGRPSSSREKVRGTVHVVFPESLDWIFHRVMQHPAHHIHSGVPLYALKGAEIVVEESGGDPVVTARWTPRYHWRLTRDCKLYDPDLDVWCNFGLEATTPASTAVAALVNSQERPLRAS